MKERPAPGEGSPGPCSYPPPPATLLIMVTVCQFHTVPRCCPCRAGFPMWKTPAYASEPQLLTPLSLRWAFSECLAVLSHSVHSPTRWGPLSQVRKQGQRRVSEPGGGGRWGCGLRQLLLRTAPSSPPWMVVEEVNHGVQSGHPRSLLGTSGLGLCSRLLPARVALQAPQPHSGSQ